MRSHLSQPPLFQPSLSLDGPRLAALTFRERMEAVALLAILLLEASGVAAAESDDGHD